MLSRKRVLVLWQGTIATWYENLNNEKHGCVHAIEVLPLRRKILHKNRYQNKFAGGGGPVSSNKSINAKRQTPISMPSDSNLAYYKPPLCGRSGMCHHTTKENIETILLSINLSRFRNIEYHSLISILGIAGSPIIWVLGSREQWVFKPINVGRANVGESKSESFGVVAVQALWVTTTSNSRGCGTASCNVSVGWWERWERYIRPRPLVSPNLRRASPYLMAVTMSAPVYVFAPAWA